VPDPNARRRRLLAPVVAALATLLVLVAAWGARIGGPRARSAGQSDRLVFHNFYEARRAEGVRFFVKPGERGPGRASRLVLPQVGRARSGRLVLQLDSRAWDEPVELMVMSGETVARTAVQGETPLALTLTGAGTSAGDLEVYLLSPPGPADLARRSHGVEVKSIAWTPLGWTWPPPRQMAVLPATAALLAALLLVLRLAPRTAALAGGIAGGALAVATAWRPLDLAPFTHRVLLFGLAWLVPPLLVGWLARDPERGGWLPAAWGPGALLVLMGAGFWAQWLFHALLCFDTGGALCPSRSDSALGAATLAGLALVALGRSPERRLHRAAVLMALAALAHGVLAWWSALHRGAVDFATLWTAARAIAAGQSPYRLADIADNHFGAVFKVPPFYGMALLPYARLSLPHALLVHRLLGTVLYLGVGAVLVRLLRSALPRALALATVVVVCASMQPTFDTLTYGQIDLVLLALLVGALLASRSARPALFGLAVAAAALFKIYPLILAGYAAARREWRAVLWTAAWLVLLVGAAVAVVGWRDHVVYLTQVVPRIGSGTGWIENQTLNGFLCRLLSTQVLPRPVHGAGVGAATSAALVVVVAASCAAAWRRAERRSAASALQFGLFVVTMLVAVPAAWMHYSTITVLPFAVLVWHAADRPFRPAAAFATALAFGLVAYGNEWTFFDNSPVSGLMALGLSLKLYGLLALWAVALFRVYATTPGPAPAPAPSVTGAPPLALPQAG